MITLTVDGKEVQAEKGKNLLQVCIENGIYIPNLCHMEGMSDPPASCRLCFVELAGGSKPVPSCKVKPVEGMVVRTDTEPVRRLQRTALRLLLSVHRAACRHCPSNRKCDLQHMARYFGVRLRPRRFEHIDRELKLDQGSSIFEYNVNRCVLCGRCVYVCEKENGCSLLTFAGRGFDTIISSYGEGEEAQLHCQQCRACVAVCPVSAISLKDPQTLHSSCQE